MRGARRGECGQCGERRLVLEGGALRGLVEMEEGGEVEDGGRGGERPCG